jgi:anti-sigma regulatory factor (Ser/Thr protein kinase)
VPENIDIRRKVERLEPPNGLGLYLIRQLVDRVDFNEKTDGGHVVKMVLKMENQTAPCPREEDQTPTVREGTR